MSSDLTRARPPSFNFAGMQHWLELCCAGLLGLGAAALVWLRGQLTLTHGVVLWSLLLIGVAVLLRRGWLRLFGPVLLYDLIRLGRRNRFYLMRFLYATVLLFLLYWTYERFQQNFQRMAWRAVAGPGRGVLYSGGPGGMQAADYARLGEVFFFTFMAVQLAAVFLLTPGYTAGAIAEEKDRRTLEFLLATDLDSREIVLSKLLARVANLALLILTGLPILSLTQFLGGVDPNLLVAGFAATALSMVSLASFSMLNSVIARKPRDAILLTYLGIAAYVGLTTLLGTWAAGSPFQGVLSSGNLILHLLELRDAVAVDKNLATIVPGMLRDYALFHGVVALFCCSVAVMRLRGIALRQGSRQQTTRTAGRWGRPRVRSLPMIWKELFIEPGFRLNWVGWVVATLAILLSLAPAVYLVGENLPLWLWGNGQHAGGFLDDMNMWARVTTTVVLCLMLVGVAVRAAGSISGERDRETMDGLLTSPLQSHDILFAKWLGSFLSVRWTWLWLFLIWGIGLATGGLHPLAVPMQLSAWIVYAGAFAGLGLWFSTSCPTTMRATMWTLSLTGGLCAFHWLSYLFCCGGRGALEFGLQSTITPPFILYWLGTPTTGEINHHEWDIGFILAMFGLMGWALVALFLWSITRSRFRRLTARMPHRRPAIYEMAASELGRRLGQKY